MLIRSCQYSLIISLIGICGACSFVKAGDTNTATSADKVDENVASVVAPGRIAPKGDVIKISVANAEDSRVNQILVEEGDLVAANQVIAVLQGQDKASQQMKEAEATVAIKQAQLDKVTQGDAKRAEIMAQTATIAEIEARIASETAEKQAVIQEASATLRNAELKYRRYQALAQEGAVRQSERDDAQEEAERARAALSQSQAGLANTTSTLKAQLDRERATLQQLQEVRPVDVTIAKAELNQALIQLQQRRVELDDTQVRVPVAGQILKINTRVGEQVNTSNGIAELGQTQQMYALTEVYETDITKVRLGQRAVLTSEYGGFSGELAGTVEHIGRQIRKSSQAEANDSTTNNPTTDTNARIVEVKVRLDPKDSIKVAALTGMQVRVKIQVVNPPQS